MASSVPVSVLSAASGAPLYARRLARPQSSGPSLPPPTSLDELLAWAAKHDDPFAGRRNPGAAAACIIQVDDGLPLYLALTAADLAAAARALASCWRLYGIRRGDYVLIYDYGTSPLTLFASWCYVPALRRGAADLIGAVPVCNDGLPELAARALHVLRYLRPRVMFVDRQVMPAFVQQVSDQHAVLADWVGLVVVAVDEELLPPEQLAAWTAGLGVPVRAVLRAGPALFFAAQCEGGAFHVDRRFYRVETVKEGAPRPSGSGAGNLCITNLFLRGTPAVRYQTGLSVLLVRGPCRCGRPGAVLRSPV